MNAPIIDFGALADAIAERAAERVFAMIKDWTPPVPEAADDPWLTVAESARYLKRSPASLALLRQNGNGPKFQKFGRSVRYRRSWLDAWGSEHQNTVYGEGRGHGRQE